MNRFGGFLKGSSKNVLTLFTGVVLAQVIALAISPLLSRLFTPEDFGVLAFFQSAAAVFIVIVTGRYELAIVLPESDEDAWSIVQLSCILAVGLTFIIFLVLSFAGENLLRSIKHSDFLPWLLWLPLFVASSAIFNICIYWNNRKDLYKNISKSKVIQVIGVSVVSLICGFLNFGPLGLILGVVFGQLFAFLSLMNFDGKINIKFNIHEIKKMADIYKKFPLINLPHAFMDALQSIVLLALIGLAFGAEVVGLYAFSMRIVRTPLVMLGSSIGSVFQSLAAKKYNEAGSFLELLKKRLRNLYLFQCLYFS